MCFVFPFVFFRHNAVAERPPVTGRQTHWFRSTTYLTFIPARVTMVPATYSWPTRCTSLEVVHISTQWYTFHLITSGCTQVLTLINWLVNIVLQTILKSCRAKSVRSVCLFIGDSFSSCVFQSCIHCIQLIYHSPQSESVWSTYWNEEFFRSNWNRQWHCSYKLNTPENIKYLYAI